MEQLLIVLFFQPPITSYLLGPNIFLSILFSNTLSLCSCLNVRMFCYLLYMPLCFIHVVLFGYEAWSLV
jgi:hypothetical protein